MTVASEITRLQGAKSDIRQAIIDKGVDVGASLTLDEYAACIDAINTGPKTGAIDFLIVGGGAGGMNAMNINGVAYSGNGGGAGGFIEIQGYLINCDSYDVKVGAGGNGNGDGSYSCFLGCCAGGGNSWGCGGFSPQGYYPGSCSGYMNGEGGGGAGAGGQGCTWANGGTGGIGKCSCISGSCQRYAGGGGAGVYDINCSSAPQGKCGGGNGGTRTQVSTAATTYGSGGGGGPIWSRDSYCQSGAAGCQGVVYIRYKTDGSCGIKPISYGGCRYTCGEYTIHRFTNTSAVEQFMPVYK